MSTNTKLIPLCLPFWRLVTIITTIKMVGSITKTMMNKLTPTTIPTMVPTLEPPEPPRV